MKNLLLLDSQNNMYPSKLRNLYRTANFDFKQDQYMTKWKNSAERFYAVILVLDD